MIQILHVLHELKRSGAEVMLRTTGEMWKQAGYECSVVAIDETVGTFASALRNSGYSCEHIPSKSSWKLLRDFRKLVRTRRFDIVHIHTERANFWLSLAALSGGSKVLRTVHSTFGFKGFLRWERIAQRAILRALGVVHVAVGESVQANERSRFRNPCITVHNWCDVDHFRPPNETEREAARASFGIEDGTFVICSVGNCSEVKNHTAILESLESLAKEKPKPAYLHVGSGATTEDEAARADKLRIAHLVRFFGVLEDPREVLWASDIFAMPSVYEGASVAAIEALSCGRVIVLTAEAASAEVVRLCGPALIRIDSPEELGMGLRRARAMGHEKRREVGQASTAGVRNLFSTTRGVRAYRELYESLMERKMSSTNESEI